MNEAQVLEVARRVLAEGRAYCEGWHSEGDCESGPSGGTTPTVAWGKCKLYISRNGSCYLDASDGRFYTVYGTHMGSGHWGMRDGKFWCDEQRKAIASAVEQRAKAVAV